MRNSKSQKTGTTGGRGGAWQNLQLMALLLNSPRYDDRSSIMHSSTTRDWQVNHALDSDTKGSKISKAQEAKIHEYDGTLTAITIIYENVKTSTVIIKSGLKN